MQLIFIKLLLCILLIAGALSINIPSGDALNFDGVTHVVLPEFTFGGAFTLEVWAQANFTGRAGPLVFFGNEVDQEQEQQQEGVAPVAVPGQYDDVVEFGIDANGVIYLQLAVSDVVSFRKRVPTSEAELEYIRPHLTTNPDHDNDLLVRRVQASIPDEFSGRWVLIHVRADSDGVVSIYVNKALVLQTSALDISVLPMILPRGTNFIGASPSESFLGQIQSVTLWSRALAPQDITVNTLKVYDGGLIGRWDFSKIDGVVVLNQAADDRYAVRQKTAALEARLEGLQEQITAAEITLASARASGSSIEIEAAEKAAAEARQALAQARYVSNPGYSAVSVALVAPDDNGEQLDNIMAVANSPDAWEDPTSVSTQIAQLTGVTRQRTANTLSDLAFIASKDVSEPDTYLKASLDAMNKLPFKATNVNSRPAIKTNLIARPSSVSNYGSVAERLDGTIVHSETGQKRWDWLGWLIRFIYRLITRCRPEDLDMRCTWSNDPHYTLKPVKGNWQSRYDYHSPSCHYILKVGDEVLIQEQSYKCGNAGCISQVGAFVSGRFLVIFYSTGKVTLNGKDVTVPYKIADDVMLIKKDNRITLVVDGIFELFFSGTAGLLFTNEQLDKADTRSICAQKGYTGQVLPGFRYDLSPSECFLDPNWQPPATQCPKCVNGRAVFDLTRGCDCECDAGWRGDLCDEFYCEKCVAPAGTCQGPNNCRCNTTDPFYVFGCSACDCKCQRDHCYNGGTVSIDNKGGCACTCPDGFSGDRCQNPRCPVGDNGFLCNGQGNCLPDGTCQCIKDVSFGEACEGNCTALVCPSDSGRTCSNHGSCVCGKCVCDPGFLGDSCSIPDCTNVTPTPDSNGCGKHGECVGTGNVPSCDCNNGWSGDRCTEFTCSPSCSQYGNCTAADPPYCRCRVGFTSPDCSIITCNFLSDCNAPKGACNLPTGADLPNCKCKQHWAGSECGKPLCPNECSHQGECIDSPVGSDSPPTCKCQAPWIGADCSELPDCEVDLKAGDWSSPEWEARAIEICSNTSYISPDHYNNCLFDARQIDNFEVLYSLAYQSYLECQHNETEGGPLCGNLCPNFCTFNGVCSPSGECQCNPGFYGADCSIQPNSRGFLFQYDGRAQESVINQVVQAASPRTYLQIGATGATQTSNEIANAAVVFLYQDYRPKYSDCKPYNDLYLAILVDQAKSSCSQSANAKFNFAVSFDVPSVAVAQAHNCKPTKTASGYSFECSWKYGQNAAVFVGPLAQNLSWAIDVSLDDTKSSCIDSLYYGSEAMTGTTDLVPIPINQASEIRIVSELLNSHCGTITSCGTCMDTYGCGWCPDLGYCMDGTASGPLYGSCSVWRFDTNPAESRVVATSGYSNPVFPSNLDVYLVDGSHVDAYAYVVFPSDKMSVESLFLVDLSEGMADVVAAFGAQASNVFSGIIKAYPDSTAALSGFTDKPISPYGSASERDYVYQEYSFKTKNASTFGAAATALKIGNGGDAANAQLEALLHVALRPSSGFTGSHRVVIVITGTPYHVPPVVGKPNNLDIVINPDEDYPFVTDVRAALIGANVVPLFLVFGGDALVANYTKLVQQIGFGVVRRTTEASIADQVMSGMEQIFSTAALVASSPKFIRDVFPASYKTIQGNSRVKFTVRLDRSALKRSELFDTQATLLAPGFGSVKLRLAKSDIPVGTDIAVTMKQNTKKTITLNGANIYNTALAFRVVSLPGNGTLWQYNEAGIQEQITAVPTEVKDGLHRVVYVPAPGGSCQHQASDYCSRRRFCYNPCPYATFQYELVDSCAASSIRVNVSVDVIADLQNNRPIAFLASAPYTPQDVNLPIFLNGYDKDNDTLSSIITTLPTKGGKLIYKGVTLTDSMLPFNVTNRTIVYSPPYRRWGDKFESFTYYINDGKKSYQMGDSAPYLVEIDVLLTNHKPQVANVQEQANEGTELTTRLIVTDEDAIDFERGEVHVFVLDAPTPAQGVLYQANGAVIKAGDEVLDTKTWVVKFKPAIYGNYTFRYHAFDSQQYSKTANMTFIVNFVNQRPTSSDAYFVTSQDVPLRVTFPGFDREGDPITWFINKPAASDALLYDEAKNNVTITTTSQYSLQSGFVLFVPTTKVATIVRVLFSVGTTRPFGGTYTMFVEVTNINDPPAFTVPKEIALSANQNARAASPFSSITFDDVDNPSADFFISIRLTGPGLIELPKTTGLTNLTITNTLITFNGRMLSVQQSLKTLTYSMTTSSSMETYTATILFEAYDFDPTEPKWGRASVVVKTSTTAAPSSVAATVGAVGAGAAAAIGLAAMYQFVKSKKLLPEESNPFASMGDEGAVDVVLENPLYRRPNAI